MLIMAKLHGFDGTRSSNTNGRTSLCSVIDSGLYQDEINVAIQPRLEKPVRHWCYQHILVRHDINIESWPSFEHLQTALALAFVFDLQTYSNGTSDSHSEMQVRLDSNLAELSSLENRGSTTELLFLLLLDVSQHPKSQIKNLQYVLKGQNSTPEFDAIVADVVARFRSVARLPLTALVLNIEEDRSPTESLNVFATTERQRNGLSAINEAEN
jgi:hypothetical protein